MADEKDTNKEKAVKHTSSGMNVLVSKLYDQEDADYMHFNDRLLVCSEHPGDEPGTISIKFKLPEKPKVYIDPLFITKADGTQIIVERSDTKKLEELGINLAEIEWYG